MPATEETYRRQSTLHVVFAITSIAMMLSMVWMILADHLRPWKQVQRQFHDVETAKLEAAEKQRLEDLRLKHRAEIDRIDADIRRAEAEESENAGRIRVKKAQIDRARGKAQKLDTSRRFLKAELDSKRSF